MQAKNFRSMLQNMDSRADDVILPMFKTTAGGATAVGTVPGWVVNRIPLSNTIISAWTIAECDRYFAEYGEEELANQPGVVLKRFAVLRHMGVRV